MVLVLLLLLLVLLLQVCVDEGSPSINDRAIVERLEVGRCLGTGLWMEQGREDVVADGRGRQKGRGRSVRIHGRGDGCRRLHQKGSGCHGSAGRVVGGAGKVPGRISDCSGRHKSIVSVGPSRSHGIHGQ